MYMYYFIGYEFLMKECNLIIIVNFNFDDMFLIFEFLSDEIK